MIDIQDYVSTQQPVTQKRLTLHVSDATHQSLLDIKQQFKHLNKTHPQSPRNDFNAALEHVVVSVIQSADELRVQYESNLATSTASPTSVSEADTPSSDLGQTPKTVSSIDTDQVSQ